MQTAKLVECRNLCGFRRLRGTAYLWVTQLKLQRRKRIETSEERYSGHRGASEFIRIGIPAPGRAVPLVLRNRRAATSSLLYVLASLSATMCKLAGELLWVILAVQLRGTQHHVRPRQRHACTL